MRRVSCLDSLDKNIPIAIYGTGTFAQNLKDALEQIGFKIKFIVDKNKFLNKSSIKNIRKVSEKDFAAIKKQIQLVVGINNREVAVFKAAAKFLKNPLIKIFYPQDIFHLVEQKMGWSYWLASRDCLLSKESYTKLKKALNYLSDDLSKQRLFSIYTYRIGLLRDYSNFIDNENQYFNALSTLKKRNLIYCDIGAFNGDTIKLALDHLSISEVYAFEPVSESFKSLINEFKTEKIRFNFLPLGVSNKYNKIPFSDADSLSESARISEEGADFINTVSLDESFNVNFDFIKIDVEGFEKEVLLGAKRTIKKNKPIIAMSLYHNSYDLWELPILIKKILPEYKLYVRQHYYNTFDCVLYCIPS